MTSFFRGGAALPAVLLCACTLQPDYRRPALSMPASWTNSAGDASTTVAPTDAQHWWSRLNDPAIDQLAAAALHDNPALAQAMARLDQARAVLAERDAAKLPAVDLEGSATRSRDRLNSSGGASRQTSAAIGTRLSWEADVWHRVRESTRAARLRIDARAADADAARLSVIGDVADAAIALRTCHLTLDVRDRDIMSRETELTIASARSTFGSIAPVALATARSNLASARRDRISQRENCLRLIDALVALSGLDARRVGALFAMPMNDAPESQADRTLADPWLPIPPPYVPALPAPILLANPQVMAAEREVAARWSDIAVARAERMPRIDLSAVLTGQWIRALGSSSSFSSNSLGATLSAPLFDGGASAANVHNAQAAYRESVAQLILAVRTAIRDIEDALAARESAALRIQASQDALDEARFVMTANEARWRAGAISQFELEESRRQFNRAQEAAIGAKADRARAWVALMRRTIATADGTQAPNMAGREQADE